LAAGGGERGDEAVVLRGERERVLLEFLDPRALGLGLLWRGTSLLAAGDPARNFTTHCCLLASTIGELAAGIVAPSTWWPFQGGPHALRLLPGAGVGALGLTRGLLVPAGAAEFLRRHLPLPHVRSQFDRIHGREFFAIGRRGGAAFASGGPGPGREAAGHDEEPGVPDHPVFGAHGEPLQVPAAHEVLPRF